MSRAVLIYLLLVIAPAGALSVSAYRMAGGDYRERIKALDDRLAEEAEALARRIEGALGDAARKADPPWAMGFTRDGHSIIHSPDPIPGAGAGTDFGAEELRYYRLSLRGGESYEYLRKDPSRALDAYAFYLPRINSPLLRSRLKLGMARAALAAGGDADARLGRAILRHLMEEGKDHSTEEGLPIDLLAASRLQGCAGADDSLRAAAGERLRATGPRLSTPLLEALVKSIAPGDADLEETLAKRRALESAVAASPEILSSKDAILGTSFLLIARSVTAAEPGGSVRSIRLEPLELPPLTAGEFTARLGAGDPERGEPGRTSRPLRLEKSGDPVASLVVEDPRRDQEIAGLGRQRALSRGLVGLLMLSTLAGGIALVRYVSKERQLAHLRARLVANVSHELKSPVTSVRLFAEMLSDDRVEGPQARRFVNHLRAESQRLSQLVENLLDLSRLARNEETLPIEPVDLSALLDRLGEGFSFLAADRKVEFATEGLLNGGAAGPVLVLTNAQAVERIVLNLLDNALKYRREGMAEIRLRLARDEGWARISISDNGPGIPRADQPRVFEEFYRARFDDYAVKGSGLGLSIARRLARKLGGDIQLESREGAGSRFTLELPVGDHRAG